MPGWEYHVHGVGSIDEDRPDLLPVDRFP